jgi:hypothetical protein
VPPIRAGSVHFIDHSTMYLVSFGLQGNISKCNMSTMASKFYFYGKQIWYMFPCNLMFSEHICVRVCFFMLHIVQKISLVRCYVISHMEHEEK